MKICKKCKKQFKSTGWINGKRQSFTGRSYCLDCSPFNIKQGYKIRKDNVL
jgi:hypothetical protein